MHKFLISFILSCFFLTTGFGQVKKDSTNTENLSSKNDNLLSVESPKDHSPTRAAMLSMALPGLGQIYNASSYQLGENHSKFKKVLRYGKLPIIYGVGGLFVYNIVGNHRLYSKYQKTLYNRQRPNYIGEDEYTGILTDDDLKIRKDNRKANRDNFIIYLILLYTANVLDASVEAHLIDFKISESLIMTYEPTIISSSFLNKQENAIGISLKLHIK